MTHWTFEWLVNRWCAFWAWVDRHRGPVGIGLLALFLIIITLGWGDAGWTIDLFAFTEGKLSYVVPVFQLYLIWWVALGVICLFDLTIDMESKHPIFLIIGIWWLVNIGAIAILQSFEFRPPGDMGALIFIGTPFEMRNVLLDPLILSPIDFTAILIILRLIVKKAIEASGWVVLFGCFMVANLYGHAMVPLELKQGGAASTAAAYYDSYMYLIFTLLLAIQAAGSFTDGVLRWRGKNFDIFADLRPVASGVWHRLSPFT